MTRAAVAKPDYSSQAAWAKRNPERVAGYQRAYRGRHREEQRARNRTWYSRNRERVLAERKAIRIAQPELFRARDAAQRRRHAAQRRENWQQWYAKNRDRLLAEQHANPRDPDIARRWRERNPQYVLAMREWKRNNPEEARTHKIARRVRLLGNGGSHTAQEWREKVELHAGCCVYCGEAKPLIREHNVPLVRGGTNAITNILPACRSCNDKKHAMTAREYIAIAGGRAAVMS